MKMFKVAVPMIVAALALCPVDGRAQAPAEPTLLYACYIPGLGVTYRIKEGTLPSACVSPKHVEFSWNQQGSKGDKGDRGDKGEQGDAGLGLVPQECPSNTFLTGFTAAGGMICRNASWVVAPPPEPPPPPPVPPSIFDGVYTISPSISQSCSGDIAPVLTAFVGSLTGFTVRRVAEAQLQITPDLTGFVGSYLSRTLASEFVVPYVQELPGSIDVTGTALIEQDPFSGTGTIVLKGSLTGSNTFQGTVSATISGRYRTPLGISLTGSCSIAPTNFIATRTGS